MSLNKELIIWKDELYWVYRKIKSTYVRDVESMKEFWMCDVALKQGELIFFCRHIPNAEIVNEEPK